jgi:hypothetical protein
MIINGLFCGTIYYVLRFLTIQVFYILRTISILGNDWIFPQGIAFYGCPKKYWLIEFGKEKKGLLKLLFKYEKMKT